MRHIATDGKLIRTYRFWARPIGTLPSEVWQIALNSQRFWNQLVQLREDVAFNCDTLPEHAQAIRARFWSLLRGKESDCKHWRISTKHAADLPWAIRDGILNRFVSSCSRAAAQTSSWPRCHDRLDRVNIFHRFAGGRPVKKLFISDKQLGWRFGLVPISVSAYAGKSRGHTKCRFTSGFFGLSNTNKITFETLLHRQLPSDGIVKRVDWRGICHPIHGWQWTIAIIVQTAAIQVREPHLACGIDFGWRARRQYIRVGIIRDSLGSVAELRLPLDAPTSKTRRHNIASSYHDLRTIDRKIDDDINSVKIQIQRRVPSNFPEDLKQLIWELETARQGGLVFLLRRLEADQSAPDILAIMRQWLSENDRLRSMRAALQDRLVRRRRWLYRNVADFLTRRYATIALEDEFAAKEMIEDRMSKDRDLPFQRSIKHYQWAAVAELRTYVLEAAAKNGTRVIGIKARWSTTTCSICDQYTPHQPSLKLTCPNGHTWDQDVNAASNILRWIKDNSNITAKAYARELDIPDTLRKIVVPMLSTDA
jgi:hypothetical protein